MKHIYTNGARNVIQNCALVIKQEKRAQEVADLVNEFQDRADGKPKSVVIAAVAFFLEHLIDEVEAGRRKREGN